jgi:hypothetical protein
VVAILEEASQPAQDIRADSRERRRLARMGRNPERPPAPMVQGLPGSASGMVDPGTMRAHPEGGGAGDREQRRSDGDIPPSHDGRPNPSAPGSSEPPSVIVIREALFTGKRRPRIRRLCECGCGKWFTTTFEDKKFKNAAHKQKKYRNVTTRAGRK